MNKKIDKLVQGIKSELGLFLSLSLGVFLFVLFFRPFPSVIIENNNYLVFVAGLSGIVFTSILLARSILPWLLNKNYDENQKSGLFPRYLSGILILAISTVSMEFYIRFVGLVQITFYISFKVIFICLASPLLLNIFDTLNRLKQENDSLLTEKIRFQKKVSEYEDDYLNKSIEFVSENAVENFSLHISEVAFIRSADNYVEIVFKEGEVFKKKLIRNTLKNIELQLSQYLTFLRCHRICIVNIHFVEKLTRSNENHWLSIKGYNEQIPVSRQYLLRIREII